MNISTHSPDEYITSEVYKWMKIQQKRLKEADIADKKDIANSYATDDFGQIRFAKNDRKSWYVRFPFLLPEIEESDDKSNQEQKNSSPSKNSTHQPPTLKKKMLKKKVLHSRYQDVSDIDENLSDESDSDIEEKDNATSQSPVPMSRDTINGESGESQTNHPSSTSHMYLRRARSELLETFGKGEDYKEEAVRDKLVMSQAAEIVHFMQNAWKLPVPELIISVIGGARLFEIMSPLAHKAFQQDLVMAAMATNAWVFTSGTHSGVTREVGDAYDKCRYKNTKIASRIPYIGIVGWYTTTGTVIAFSISFIIMFRIYQDYKQLEQYRYKSGSEKSLADSSLLFNKSSKERERLYRTRQPSRKEKPETFPLDHNHTHFLMLQDEFGEDDNRDKKPEYHDIPRIDLILDLRAQIEEESRKITSQEQSSFTPIVQILVNGGASSIVSVCESIRRNTPVIVIKGSGRAADLIADEYEHLYGRNEERSNVAYTAAKKTIEFQKYDKKHEFGRTATESIINSSTRKKLIEMIQSEGGYFLLNFFELIDGAKQLRLDDAIMEAQLNAALKNDDERAQRTKELQLAIAWNKYDRVTNAILTNQTALRLSDVDLDDALKNALRRNSLNFVDILMGYGASFERLRRLINIIDLYKDLDTNALLANLPVEQNLYSRTGENLYPAITSLVENIRVLRVEMQDRISNKDDIQSKHMQKDYYTTYFGKKITIHHPDFEQTIHHSASHNTYGILDRFGKSESFFHNMLVFSCNDIIRKNGHVTEISIHFSKLPDDSQSIVLPSIFLYVISPTKEKDRFDILYRYQLSDEQIKQLLNKDIKDKNLTTGSQHIRKATFPEPTLYLKAGEFLGIGFGRYSGFPYHVRGSDSCYVDLNTADEALKTGKTQLFIRQAIYCVTFSFTIRPALSFIRDLLLWSLFVDRSTLASCLCSYSDNTIAATLLSSKIYRIAAEIENQEEKKQDYIQKARKFDDHAARIIEACYNIDEDFAVEILTAKSKLYFNYSPWELAKINGSRSFLATKCVQKHLDKLWYGEVNRRGHASYFIDILIFILCLFPPLIPIAVKYSKTLALNKPAHEPSSTNEWSFGKFYHNRAIIRFYYNIIFYIAFLGLFSFVLLVDYFPRNNNGGHRNGFTNIEIPVTEIILHIGMLSIIVEEFVEFGLYCKEKSSYNNRSIVWKYFADDKWNILDLVAILVYLLGFATRFTVIESIFVVSKISMCIALFLWYVRILHLFVASERLGTKLLMIFNTMKDLLFFICFILIFLIGYSVASYALITTNQQVEWDNRSGNSPSTTYTLTNGGSDLWNWTIVRNVIDWGMWKVYGQVDLLSYSQVDNNTLNADNDAYGTTVFILTIIFVCVANVLLLNVLVALFNVTLDKTKNFAHMSWAYHRFLLVDEYGRKSPLPPPFNLFYYMYKLIEYLIMYPQNKLNNHIYGSLDDKSELDSNIYDAITFNAMDKVEINGTIDAISINFSTAPTADEPDIWLFVIKDAETAWNLNNLNNFEIVKSYKLPIRAENINREERIQTFTTVNIPIQKDQYLGIRFSPDAGNPFSTERDQYYSYFDDSPYPTQPLEFTRCQTKGIAMSFNVRTETNAPKVNRWCPCLPITRKTKPVVPRKQENASLVKRQTYRTYDNMLREHSIAHDYWINIIERLKKEERDLNHQHSTEEIQWKKVVEFVHEVEKTQS